MELLKLLSANEVVMQLIAFLVLFFVLRAFLWDKLLKFLDQRREKIAAELKGVEDSRQEASKLKSDYDGLLAAIENTAKEKIKEAVAVGQEAQEEIIKKAHYDAEKIIEGAKKEIKFEIAKSKDELKKKIVELTINMTADLIQERLSPEKDAMLIEELLEKADKINEN